MSDRVSRREWLAGMARLVAGGSVMSAMVARRPAGGDAGAPRRIVVYKDPACGCCTKWLPQLRAAGFEVETHDRGDMDAFKDSVGVPVALRSCHTAVAGRFLVEGHVPAADVARLLAKPPAGIVGLAVPGMPAGSPGMEMGGRRDRYDVVAFRANGATSVFASHA